MGVFNLLIISYNQLNNSKKIELDKFIFSLGIRHVGETTSRLLAKEFLNIENFIKNSNNYERFNLIDGVGPKAVNSILEFFLHENNISSIKNLVKVLKIKKFTKTKTNNFFSNKNIVFTGTLLKLSREEAKHLTQEMGAKISSSISKSTDFLVIGEKSRQ